MSLPFLLLAVVLLCTVACASGRGLTPPGSGRSQPSAAATTVSTGVALSAATNKQSYTSTDDIGMTLTLKNTTGAPIAVSTRWEGTVSVVSCTRDGAPVMPQQQRVRFEEDLSSLLLESLQTIPPGGTATVGNVLPAGTQPGGHMLDTVQFDPNGAHQLVRYDLSKPGRYQITLRYAYPGPAGGNVPVFSGQTSEVTLSFTVS